MRKTMFVVCVLLAALACAPAASAQDNQTQPAESVHFYHLKLVVQELDANGKVTNSRSYSTTVSTGKETGYNSNNSIRTGTRVPVASGVFSAGGASNVETQFQYIDIGTNFDIHDVHESGRQLSLHIKADISSEGNEAVIGNSREPVIRHNQWEASALIPIDKPTVIFNSDALDSKGAMQVVATATPIP